MDNFDLLEIHSTALESLFTAYYDQIYTEGVTAAKFYVLDQMMTMVTDGCIQDEFQRRIYDDPDMTLEEINELYASICAEFEQPMYYISYAASCMATIQIWELAQKDFQAGVDTWKAVLEATADGSGYMTVLPACGLKLFTEEGAVAEVLEPLLDELARLDAMA